MNQTLTATLDNATTRKHLYDTIAIITKMEQEEVFRILKREHVEFTENANGVFFDISAVESAAFLKLLSFTNLCLEQRKNQELRERQLEELREEIAGTIGAEVEMPPPRGSH